MIGSIGYTSLKQQIFTVNRNSYGAPAKMKVVKMKTRVITSFVEAIHDLHCNQFITTKFLKVVLQADFYISFLLLK